MQVKPKTFEEHREYLHAIIRLQLWFAWHWTQSHEHERIQHVIRQRIDIYRKTAINPEGMNPRQCHWDSPDWQQLEAVLIACFQDNHSDAATFEERAFAEVCPYVDARCKRDFEERPYVLDYQCGSLKYDAPSEDAPQRVFMHIANALTPRSIFEDPDYLPRCLCELMDKSEKEYGASALTTDTWLNTHPAWLRLFPAVWQQRMQAPDCDVRWHFGFWGQFISARGTFNHKLGRQLRETGRFPYYPRRSWCSFAELRSHMHVLR